MFGGDLGMGLRPSGDTGGPRRGRWFGDEGRFGGRRGLPLLLGGLALVVLLLLLTLLL